MKKSVWQGKSNKLYWRGFIPFVFFFHSKYLRTWDAGFVSDFTGFMHRIDGASIGGVWDCFGFPAMHQVTNFFLFCFVKWFGVGGIGWYLVFTSLHLANTALGFVLAKKIFERYGNEKPEELAFIASILFLMCPYQAEVLVWRVCFNFLFCTLTMLGSMLLWLQYCEAKKPKHLLLSLGLFVVALFTFELAVVLPLLLVPLTWPLTPKGEPTEYQFTELQSEENKGVSGFRFPFRGQGSARALLPYFAILASYFLLNKLVLGGWAGHYGEATHLNFDLRLIASNCLKYFTKYLLWWREWPHNAKEQFLLFLEQPAVAWGGLAVGLAMLWLLTSARFKTSPTLRLVGFSWLLFFLALAPVANLYVAYILHGENDRYGYFASLFFFVGLVALCSFLPKWLRYGVLIIYLVASYYFLNSITDDWKRATKITTSLLQDFRWQDAPEVYVLASPDNYDGIPIFKDFSRENLAIKHALKYLADKPAKGDFYQVAQFNMTDWNNGFEANRDSTTGFFHLQFKQWGNWWWLYGMGLGDYQNEQYRFRTDGNGCRVEMKQWPPKAGSVFIVAQGGSWQEL
ncbi:MAG: hypothetical protein IT258_06850 [Saprospiraceae bacterium]|nr:hypothetical protein [Saprospiraceae bacterium]